MYRHTLHSRKPAGKQSISTCKYSHEEKEMFIKYIFSNVDLSRYRYKLIDTESDLNSFGDYSSDDSIKSFSANFSGSNCLLVFCRLREYNYSFFVDRKTLSYNLAQIDYDNLNIIPAYIKLDSSVYKGTILDGTYIFNNRKKETMYMITDAYMFRGLSMITERLKLKLMRVSSYIEENLSEETKIQLYVSKLYELKDIKTAIEVDFPKIKEPHIRGLCFYPNTSGIRLIYVFPETTHAPISTTHTPAHTPTPAPLPSPSIKITTPKPEPEPRLSPTTVPEHDITGKVSYVALVEEEISAVLEVKKTGTNDVYKIYMVEEETHGKKKLLKRKKMGIAYIPDKETSILCRNIINKNVSGKALFKCIFNTEKNKWIPREECTTQKLPDKFSCLDGKLTTYIESDSEGDI